MNRFLSIALLFLFFANSTSAFGNWKKEDSNSGKYRKVVLNMEDGSQKSGFIKEFRKSVVVNNGNNLLGNKSMENKFGLQTQKFSFKKNLDSKKETVSIDQIKSIEFVLSTDDFNINETIVYEKVKLAKLKNNHDLKKENAFTLLPVYYKNSKITVYYFIVNDFPKFYFKGSRVDYALYQNFKMTDIFKPQNYTDRLYGIFEFIGKDCPEYLGWINSVKNKTYRPTSKPVLKETSEYKILDSYQKDIKTAKKEMSEEEYEAYLEWRSFQKTKGMMDSSYSVYNEFVVQYINSCE